mmetsp:Transcript_85969/g.248157  ORF Transcript_85969/g.248157 Transcript_85969/m.248157 type:complete len:229 (-) Transcript_85969:305-991(-)
MNHELRHIWLVRLGLDHLAIDQRVLLSADAIVRRRLELRMPDRPFRHINSASPLVHIHVLAIKVLREVVAIVQYDLPPPNVDRVSDPQVLRQIYTPVRAQHAGIGIDMQVLCKRSALEENRVSIAARIPGMRFIDLDRVVRQVIVDRKVHPGAIQRRIVPKGLETQDPSVVEQKLCQLLIRGGLAYLVLRQQLRVCGLLRWRQASSLGRLLELVRQLPTILDNRLVLT